MSYIDKIQQNEATSTVNEAEAPVMLSTLRNRVITKVESATNAEELYECLSILERPNMPCAIAEEELDNEIELAMQSGNATSAEVNKVFTRWMH